MSPQQPLITMDLLGKYLAGEATPEEAVAIDDWRSLPENKQEFDELLNLHSKIVGQVKYSAPVVEEHWQALVNTIEHQRSGTSIGWVWYLAAACCVGIIGIVWFFSMRSENLINNQQTVVRQAKQLPVADTLSDGSVVTINKGSIISYSAEFSARERTINLHGESYFQVTADAKRPFIIHISGLTIQVIGTSFNVKEYTDSKNIEVQVTSGIVKMRIAANELEVRAGQTGIYNIAAQTLERQDTINQNSLSYATKTFYFTDISLEEACRYLEEAFQVKIILDKKESAGCRLTAQFTNKSLDYILEVINATLGSTSSRVGNSIQLHAATCE